MRVKSTPNGSSHTYQKVVDTGELPALYHVNAGMTRPPKEPDMHPYFDTQEDQDDADELARARDYWAEQAADDYCSDGE